MYPWSFGILLSHAAGSASIAVCKVVSLDPPLKELPNLPQLNSGVAAAGPGPTAATAAAAAQHLGASPRLPALRTLALVLRSLKRERRQPPPLNPWANQPRGTIC